MVVPSVLESGNFESIPTPPSPTKVTLLGVDLWDVVNVPKNGTKNTTNHTEINEIQFVSPYIPYDPWVKWFEKLSISSKPSYKLAYACGIPMGVAGMTVFASMLPGVVYQGRFSKICKILVITLGFLVSCIHMIMNLCIRVLGVGESQNIPRIRIMVAAASLHIAMHTLYHASNEVSKITKKTRRGSNQLIIALPLIWSSMFFVMHGGIALVILPLILLDQTCFSPQDIISMHAVTAFLPEIMGTMYSRFLHISGAFCGDWGTTE